MKNHLMSTVDDHGMYKYILNSIIKKVDKEFKKKIKIKKIKLINISPNYIFFILKNLILGTFFIKERLVSLTYKKCNIGRYICSALYRDFSTYESWIKLYINIFKFTYIAGKIFYTAHDISKKNEIFYFDHIGYLNGIFYEVLSKKKKIIFCNIYPRGFFFIDFRIKKNSFFIKIERLLRLRKLKNLNISEVNKKIIFFERIMKEPDLIPYMKSTRFEKIKNFNSNLEDIKKFEYVIYAHSFLDAQLWYGNDGFVNLYDWLEFTIKKLKEKKVRVLVKSHPNFYNKSIGQLKTVDHEEFMKLSNKYSSDEVVFLNQPIKNGDLLKTINKKTILISHHGTALLEGLYSGFKCISSIATLWDKEIKITNQWKNQKEYAALLNKNWNNLKMPKKNDLLNLIYQIFLTPNSLYGNKHYLEIISKISKISREKMFKFQHKIKIDKDTEFRIINEISKNIEKIVY